MPQRRVGRLPGFAYKGEFAYVLTLCTFARRERFADPRVVAETDRIFRDSGVRWAFQFLAYCYMPDHLHLLVEGTTPHSDLIEFVKHAKQRSGCWHAQRYRLPLWQSGWFDQIVRDSESIERHVLYTLANPVRAGRVDQWDEWPYSGTTLAVVDEGLARRQA